MSGASVMQHVDVQPVASAIAFRIIVARTSSVRTLGRCLLSVSALHSASCPCGHWPSQDSVMHCQRTSDRIGRDFCWLVVFQLSTRLSFLWHCRSHCPSALELVAKQSGSSAMAGMHGFMIFLNETGEIIRFTVTNDEPAQIKLSDDYGSMPHGFFKIVKEEWGCWVNMGITWSRAEGQKAYQCTQEAKNVFHSCHHKLVVVFPEPFGIPMAVGQSDFSVADNCFMWFPDRPVRVQSVTVQEDKILFKSFKKEMRVHGFGQKVEMDRTVFWIIQFHYGGNDEEATTHVFEKSDIEGLYNVYVPVNKEVRVEELRGYNGTTDQAKRVLSSYDPYHGDRALMVRK